MFIDCHSNGHGGHGDRSHSKVGVVGTLKSDPAPEGVGGNTGVQRDGGRGNKGAEQNMPWYSV